MYFLSVPFIIQFDAIELLVNKHSSTLSPQYLLRFACKIFLDFFLPKKVTINIFFPILHILYTLEAPNSFGVSNDQLSDSGIPVLLNNLGQATGP